jgi:hypothetical protein
VFWTKAVPLCVLAVAGAALLDANLTSNAVQGLTDNNFDRVAPLLAAVLLDLALWGALCTVVFRETIRGFLYCGASFIALTIVLGLAHSLISLTEIEILGQDMPWRGQPAQGIIFGAALLTLTPLPLFGILETIHRSRLKHRLTPTPSLGITVFLFFGFACLTSYWLRTDGSTSILNPRELSKSHQVAATGTNGDRFQYVTTEDGLTLHTVDINHPLTTPSQSLIIDSSPSGGRKPSYVTGRVFQDRALLVRSTGGENGTWLDLYKASEPNQTGPLQSISFTGTYRQISPNALAVLTQPKSGGGLEWVEYDIETGEVLEVPGTEAGAKPSSYDYQSCVTTGERRYRNQWKQPKGILIEDPASPVDAKPLGTTPRLAPAAVDRNLVAGFPDEPPDREFFRTKIFDEVHLYDTTDPKNPALHRIGIPYRLHRGFRITGRILELLGLRVNTGHGSLDSLGEMFPTLGGGYLCVWCPAVLRVAVWDVRSPNTPQLVGIAATPYIYHQSLEADYAGAYWYSVIPPVTPIERSDGALGFLHSNCGIVWLEFPQLMKGDGA